MNNTILHIAGCDKFIPPFIEFVKKHFNFNEHEFLLTNGMATEELKPHSNVHLAKRGYFEQLKHYSRVVIKMHQAPKVILHGLFDLKLVVILFFMPWLLKKCYWVMWGGDLYVYKIGKADWKWKCKEFFRRPVIRNMGNFVGYTTGDYELARQWYGASGKYHRCFFYTSNMCNDIELSMPQHSTVNILVGNSADPSNNHLEVFNKIKLFQEEDIKIFVPLTYGKPDYAKKIVEEGERLFGNKFKPILDHMPFDEYIKFLGKVDIAIFNHKRQQAMGNIRTLLGLGKKVYIRQELTSTRTLNDDGIKTFSLDDFSLNDEFPEKNENIRRIKETFSEKALINGLDTIWKS